MKLHEFESYAGQHVIDLRSVVARLSRLDETLRGPYPECDENAQVGVGGAGGMEGQAGEYFAEIQGLNNQISAKLSTLEESLLPSTTQTGSIGGDIADGRIHQQ